MFAIAILMWASLSGAGTSIILLVKSKVRAISYFTPISSPKSLGLANDSVCGSDTGGRVSSAGESSSGFERQDGSGRITPNPD